jgi:curved DNA-binding protein CbpA
MTDPFSALGLPARPGLTDDEVRAAWRRVAAATHPDRPDGGDPARFAAAAAAYTTLRTPFGRGEALADLAAASHGEPGASRPPRAWPGRVARLAGRAVLAAAVGLAAAATTGSHPATPALITGALTWLVLASRRDLPRQAGPRPGPREHRFRGVSALRALRQGRVR